jgi:hypothetical protein
LGILIAGAAVNLSAVVLLSPTLRYQRVIVATLRKHLVGLGFREQEYERFAREFCGERPMNSKEKRLSLVWPVYFHTNLLEHSPVASQLESYAEKVVTSFLLATDWFDDTRNGPPRYLGLYTSDGTPVLHNPLAKLRVSNE